MEIIALVCGILSLTAEIGIGTQYGAISGLSLWLGEVDPITIIIGLVAIAGIVFGIISLKKKLPKKAMATAGLVMSIIALALHVLVAVACSLCYNRAFNAFF